VTEEGTVAARLAELGLTLHGPHPPHDPLDAVVIFDRTARTRDSCRVSTAN
jgi:hypothetical protein